MYDKDFPRSPVQPAAGECPFLDFITHLPIEGGLWSAFIYYFCSVIISSAMKIIEFIRKWTLLCAIVFGLAVYLLFTEIPPLRPVGYAAGPWCVKAVPYLIFLLLYLTFCKIDMENMRPRAWHFWLQLIRTTLSGFFVMLILLFGNVSPDVKLVLEGCFVCFICPTAASAAVVTEKLGGSIASLTVFTLIANIVTSIIVPLFFPMVEKGSDITFLYAFMLVLRRVVTVLLVPLCLALLTRHFLPKVADRIKRMKNVAFYIWCVNLSIVAGMTCHNIACATASGWTLFLLLLLPFAITLIQFSIGKWVGGFYGDRVSAGQALGQKNTVVGIWLTVTFLNPVAAVAPGAYVLWQNLVNSWQLWCKEKYGYLKW